MSTRINTQIVSPFSDFSPEADPVISLCFMRKVLQEDFSCIMESLFDAAKNYLPAGRFVL